MELILYKYKGRSNVANKYSDTDDMVEVYRNSNITPYGSFNAVNVVFRLQNKYDVNYAKYNYNGNTYSGFCTVNVDSKGLYVYNITIDVLTTAYEGGCFDATNLVTRITTGTSLNKDSAIPWEDTVATHKIEIGSAAKDYKILIQSVWCGDGCINEATDSTQYVQDVGYKQTNIEVEYASDYRIYPTGVITYLLTKSQWKIFLRNFQKLSESQQVKVATSILRIAIIDNESLGTQGTTLFRVACSATGFSGLSTAISFMGESGKNISVPISEVEAEHISQVDWDSSALFYRHGYSGSSYVTNSVNVNLSYSAYNDTKIQFNYIHGGNHTLIALRDIKLPSVTSVGYKAVFDPGTFSLMYIPLLNGDGYFQYRTEAQIGTTFPIPADTSVTNWGALLASAVAIALPIAAGIPQAYLGTESAKLMLRGAEIGYKTGEMSFGQSLTTIQDAVAMKRTAMQGLSTNVLGPAGAYASQSIGTFWQSATGGYSLVGQAGGSTSWADNDPNYIIVYETKPDVGNITNWCNIYGRPHNGMMNLSEIPANTGYVQTGNCKLRANGYPIAIVEAAESICDSGYYMQ